MYIHILVSLFLYFSFINAAVRSVRSAVVFVVVEELRIRAAVAAAARYLEWTVAPVQGKRQANMCGPRANT